MSVLESSDDEVPVVDAVTTESTAVVPAAEGTYIPAGNSGFSDNEALAFTQQIRMTVVGQLLGSGKIPEEKSDKTLLVNMLDGIDRAALGRLRIQTEQDSANQLAEATRSITHLLNTVTADVYTSQVPVERVLPEIPEDRVMLVESRLVVGELDSSYNEETIEEFKARTNPDLDN